MRRGAIDLAHRRIAALELEIAAQIAHRSRSSPAIVGIIVVCALSIVGLLGGTWSRVRSERAAVAAAAAARPSSPSTFIPTFGNGPVGALIDDSPEEDLVAMFHRPNGGVEVVAIDGKNFAPIWRRDLFHYDQARWAYRSRFGDPESTSPPGANGHSVSSSIMAPKLSWTRSMPDRRTSLNHWL